MPSIKNTFFTHLKINKPNPFSKFFLTLFKSKISAILNDSKGYIKYIGIDMVKILPNHVAKCQQSK